MTINTRQPQWNIYEAAVLLDAYIETLKKEQPKSHIIKDVSVALRQMAVNQGLIIDDVFRNENGTRTSHHLIFLSKSFRGYEIMKDIMYRESSEQKTGVASFEYNPMNAKYKQDSILDMLSTPIDKLENMLKQQYSGQTIGFIDLYQTHSVDRPYIKKNYKDVLSKMYKEGTIHAWNRKNGKPPRANSFSDDMIIKFEG